METEDVIESVPSPLEVIENEVVMYLEGLAEAFAELLPDEPEGI